MIYTSNYRFDGADNVVYFEDVKSTGSARWMGYDAVDRLVDVASPGRWGDWGYQYDKLGNRTSKARTPASGGYQAVGYQYDANNRLTMSTGPEPVGPMSLEWDRAGRLSKTTNTLTGVATAYAYDGHGRRVEKAEPSETTVYHYDAAGRVTAETGLDGAKRRDYFYLGNKLIAVDSCATGNSPTCAEWYHTDALGSVAARTNGAGTIVAQLDYQPWGEQWAVQGDGGDRQYNGRVFDPGTGFHDYGARMYWPQIGRFVSADSVMGSPASPMTLNRYSYVLNNPYKYVDPTGQLVVGAAAAAAEGGFAGAGAAGGAGAVTTVVWAGGAALVSGGVVVAGIWAVENSDTTWGSGPIGNMPVVLGPYGAGDGAGLLSCHGSGGSRTAPTLPPRVIASDGDVDIEHYYRSGDHGPAHAHVVGGGEDTRIGPKGQPLAGDPPLSPAQNRAVQANKPAVRKAVNKIGRWLEHQEATQSASSQTDKENR